MKTYRIVLADDQKQMRECIKQILSAETDLEIVGEADSGSKLLEILRSRAAMPEMVIVDISMPGMSGIDATRWIKDCFPDIQELILTVHDDREYLRQAILAGASGYVVKDDAYSELLPAISAIRKGRTFVSRRLSSAGNA